MLQGPKDFVFEISRTQFERASRELFNKLVEKCALLSLEEITPVYDDDGRLNYEATIEQNPNA